MLRVVIIGDPGSGKTTFLGLLYATQVRSATDPKVASRFHVPVESLEVIEPVFHQLMSGGFPDQVAKEGISGFSFQVSNRRTARGLIPHLRGRREPDASTTIRFTLTRSGVEELSRLLRGGSVVDNRWGDMYGSDVVAIVVDSTKLAANGGHPEGSPTARYDEAVDSLLTMIQRLREPGRRGSVHPIFIFTKFDRVRPEVMRASSVASSPPRVGESGSRAAYGQALLGHHLPKTLAKVQARAGDGGRFAKPVYVFSSVRTEESTPGQTERIHRRRNEAAGLELDYSRLEYVALLDHLSGLAQDTTD